MLKYRGCSGVGTDGVMGMNNRYGPNVMEELLMFKRSIYIDEYIYIYMLF